MIESSFIPASGYMWVTLGTSAITEIEKKRKIIINEILLFIIPPYKITGSLMFGIPILNPSLV